MSLWLGPGQAGCVEHVKPLVFNRLCSLVSTPEDEQTGPDGRRGRVECPRLWLLPPHRRALPRSYFGVQHLDAAAVPRGVGTAEHPEARGTGGGQERGVLVARPQPAPAGGNPAERGCGRVKAIGHGTGPARSPGSSPA